VNGVARPIDLLQAHVLDRWSHLSRDADELRVQSPGDEKHWARQFVEPTPQPGKRTRPEAPKRPGEASRTILHAQAPNTLLRLWRQRSVRLEERERCPVLDERGDTLLLDPIGERFIFGPSFCAPPLGVETRGGRLQHEATHMFGSSEGHVQRDASTHGVPDEIESVEMLRLRVESDQGIGQGYRPGRHVPTGTVTRKIQG